MSTMNLYPYAVRQLLWMRCSGKNHGCDTQLKQGQEGGKIDYALRLADIDPLFYVVAMIIGIIVWMIFADESAGLLAGYCFFAFSVTVLSREPFEGKHFEPVLFWSWSRPDLYEEILMNVICFVPIGLLGAKLQGWKMILYAAICSLSIELLQMVLKRGLFEFDDIVHNTVGAVLGVLLYFAIRKLRSFREQRDLPNMRE